MGHRFIISDTHFGQDSIYGFLRADGCRLRPWASSAEEGDELMVDAWNRIVRPGDTVYHLGDAVITRPALHILGRLNGRLILIKGNHDIFAMKDYLPYVKDIRSTHKHEDLELTHKPVHPDSLGSWALANIHGHMHGHEVMLGDAPDPRYFNACREDEVLAPVEIGDVRAQAAERQTDA